MSVINQVLNQLEQRGVPAAPGQTMVRAVPSSSSSLAVPLLALAIALGLAAWQWQQTHEMDVAAQNVARQQTVVAAVAPVPRAVLEEIPPELSTPVSRLSDELAVPPSPAVAPDAPAVASDTKDTKGIKPVKTSESRVVMPALTVPARTAPGPAVPAQTAQAPRPMPVAAANAPSPANQPAIGELPLKRVSPAQLADAEFRKAAQLMQQGRIADAANGYEAALQLDAGHQAARQAWVALLLEGKRHADAERVLQEGLAVRPEQTGFAMLLARLQVERGALDQAVATLKTSLPQAGLQGDYHAFLAALLQRQGSHATALDHYQAALRQAPGNGRWLMGYGISLQAAQRGAEAREAFLRALDSGTLSPELQAFVRQKLGE